MADILFAGTGISEHGTVVVEFNTTREPCSVYTDGWSRKSCTLMSRPIRQEGRGNNDLARF
jgi:hypothetical protein